MQNKRQRLQQCNKLTWWVFEDNNIILISLHLFLPSCEILLQYFMAVWKCQANVEHGTFCCFFNRDWILPVNTKIQSVEMLQLQYRRFTHQGQVKSTLSFFPLHFGSALLWLWFYYLRKMLQSNGRKFRFLCADFRVNKCSKLSLMQWTVLMKNSNIIFLPLLQLFLHSTANFSHCLTYCKCLHL